MIDKAILARDIHVGDAVNLEGDSYADPHRDHPEFECEYQIVCEVKDEGRAIAIGFDSTDTVGYPPDYVLVVRDDAAIKQRDEWAMDRRVKALRIRLINSDDGALVQMQRQLSDAQLRRVMELHDAGLL